MTLGGSIIQLNNSDYSISLKKGMFLKFSEVNELTMWGPKGLREKFSEIQCVLCSTVLGLLSTVMH